MHTRNIAAGLLLGVATLSAGCAGKRVSSAIARGDLRVGMTYGQVVDLTNARPNVWDIMALCEGSEGATLVAVSALRPNNDVLYCPIRRASYVQEIQLEVAEEAFRTCQQSPQTSVSYIWHIGGNCFKFAPKVRFIPGFTNRADELIAIR